MARLLGMLLVALTAGFLLNTAAAQDTTKKATLDFEAIFKKLDTDSDGFLSKDEFVKLCDNFKNKEQARAKLEMAYDKLERSVKGLSRDQFRSYLDNVKKTE